jgi:hypothetical protein
MGEAASNTCLNDDRGVHEIENRLSGTATNAEARKNIKKFRSKRIFTIFLSIVMGMDHAYEDVRSMTSLLESSLHNRKIENGSLDEIGL